MKVRDHRPSPNGSWCLFCGTRKREDGTWPEELNCVLRDDGITELRPEPRRRQAAHLDADTISRRIGELYQARTEAMNHVEPEPTRSQITITGADD